MELFELAKTLVESDALHNPGSIVAIVVVVVYFWDKRLERKATERSHTNTIDLEERKLMESSEVEFRRALLTSNRDLQSAHATCQRDLEEVHVELSVMKAALIAAGIPVPDVHTISRVPR